MQDLDCCWRNISVRDSSSFRSRTRRLFERGERAKAWNENGVLSAGKISFSFATRQFNIFFIFAKIKDRIVSNRLMKPKIKYDVNVLGMKNTKSMMKNFFYEETMQHNESTISSLVVQ